MALGKELGPLAGLQGTWEGDQGLDVAYSNEKGEIGDTPYREKTTFNPFGPVENGRQVLYGLDYRTAAWRDEEEQPVPHRGRLLAVGRGGGPGHALLHGAPRHGHPGRR